MTSVIPCICRHLSWRKSHPLTSHRAVCSATASGCNRLTEVGNVRAFIRPVQGSSSQKVMSDIMCQSNNVVVTNLHFWIFAIEC